MKPTLGSDSTGRPQLPQGEVTPAPAHHHEDIVTTSSHYIDNLAVLDFVKHGVLNPKTVAEVVDWCGHAGEAVLLDAVLQRCESQGDLALSKVTVSADSDDRTEAILRVIANHPSICAVNLVGAVVEAPAAAALRDLLAPPGGQTSRILSLEFNRIAVENSAVMRAFTKGLKESSVQSLTIDHQGMKRECFQNLLTAACQNVNLVNLTLLHPRHEGDSSDINCPSAIVASHVRCLRIVSDDFDVHANFVMNLASQHYACSLASLELAASEPQQFDEGDHLPEEFWLQLVMFAYLSNIAAVNIQDLDVPSDPDTLELAAHWLKAPTVGQEVEPASPNQNLLVFDHPGLDLGPELTRQFQELTHDNRKRFALPDAFFKGAARSFGGQATHAPDMGDEIAKRLRPETGPGQDELRLALLNTTSYRAAMTGRSGEFRNELFKLIDGRKTGAIHTLRQMMLEAHVGLTEQHLDQVWQRASERGVELPDLPVQWLPPDRQ